MQSGVASACNLTPVGTDFWLTIDKASQSVSKGKSATFNLTVTPLNFTATASSMGNWLFVSPTSGVTSTILSIFVNPVGLDAGTYTGAVTVAVAALWLWWFPGLARLDRLAELRGGASPAGEAPPLSPA